ncbi:MAG: GNAT family N-acetyltransferase [Hyphomonadaceae bacterium]
MAQSGSRARSQTGPRIAIRDARPADAAEVERIETLSFEGDRLSRRSLLRHLASDTADVLIAALDGETAGYAMNFYRSTTPIARLYSIATYPHARGMGVAAALVEACERAARRRGCTVLRLEVREDNAGAIRLYERMGYVRFGRRESYYDDGAPAIRMEKPLPAGRVKVKAVS